MIKCTKCQRIYKRKYESCPICKTTNFKEIEEKQGLIIETPPKEGYKVDLSNFKKMKNLYTFVLIFSTSMLLIITILEIIELLSYNFIELSLYIITNIFFLLLPVGVIVPFIIISFSKIKKINTKMNQIKILATKGTLIKNLKFKIINTNNILNNKIAYAISIEYPDKNGKTMKLISEDKYEEKLSKENYTVDLLIDKNNNENYYIAYEIY